MDNLESCTYEVFEKDPVKYEEYGKVSQIEFEIFDYKFAFLLCVGY